MGKIHLFSTEWDKREKEEEKREELEKELATRFGLKKEHYELLPLDECFLCVPSFDCVNENPQVDGKYLESLFPESLELCYPCKNSPTDSSVCNYFKIRGRVRLEFESVALYSLGSQKHEKESLLDEDQLIGLIIFYKDKFLNKDNCYDEFKGCIKKGVCGRLLIIPDFDDV